jgi:hypothetical protein
MRSGNASLRASTAAARFDALPPAARMALVRELVRTRGHELERAYDSVMLVTAGFRSRREGGVTPFVHPEPCVVFGVDRKWHARDEDAAQRIPHRIPTQGTAHGRRVHYAVPTDVQPARWFHGGVARSASAVRVEGDEPDFVANGTITCVVRVQTADGEQGFGLSALHVLSPAPVLDAPEPAAGAPFSLVGSGVEAGASVRWGGGLFDAAASFDAQLADIGGGAWLGAAFAGLSLSPAHPSILDREEFDGLAAMRRFLILAPENHAAHAGAPRAPMVAQFRGYVPGHVPIDYPVRAGGVFTFMPITHTELLLFEVIGDAPAPEPGDSGAAVLTWRADGALTLAGMFIASMNGDDARTVFVLPSWQLFDLENWRALPTGSTRITPDFSLP